MRVPQIALAKLNIVQAEFFLVSVDSSTLSLKAYLNKLRERVEDGMPVKRVVRFYDQLDSFLPFVMRNKDVETPDRKKASAKLAVEGLMRALKQGGPVAVETWDHRFRPLRPDEAHELLESVKRAESAWLFVFAHNSLLSETNKVLGSCM